MDLLKGFKMNGNQSPAGWYPQMDGTTRYWDGQNWAPASPPANGAGPWKVVAIVLAVLLFLGLAGTVVYNLVDNRSAYTTSQTSEAGMTHEQFNRSLNDTWNKTSTESQNSICLSWKNDREGSLDAFVGGLGSDGPVTRKWATEWFDNECAHRA